MNRARHRSTPLLIALILGVNTTNVTAQEKPESAEKEARRAARLEFMRNAVEQITITPVDPNDKRDLKIKPQPLLRYGDPARGVADSAVWRVGSKGRPVALITSEVYGPLATKTFQMNQEFLAVENPRLIMRTGNFYWTPPNEAMLKLQPLPSDDVPADKPTLRLNQMKRLAQKFTLREFYMNENIELRLLPTPIDRYELPGKPSSDGAIFAGVWGVNPEVLLFIESDGAAWSYGFVRSGAAKLWAVLDGKEVWSVPASGIDSTQSYAININATKVPTSTFEEGN